MQRRLSGVFSGSFWAVLLCALAIVAWGQTPEPAATPPKPSNNGPALLSLDPRPIRLQGLPNTIEISGKVRYYDGQKLIPGVVMTLEGDSTQIAVTGADGAFSFLVSPGGNYELTPQKTTDHPPNLGVTTLDLALLRRDVLGIVSLDSPYKLLAGDVNLTAPATTGDIALIRGLVLGLTNALPAGLWRFAPSDYVFEDARQPWNAPTNRVYEGLLSSRAGQDFIAIKLGDMDKSWTVPTVNTPPTVSLSSPTAGAIFTEPALVAITALAEDVDGKIVLAEFFAGETRIGQSTAPPFTFVWSGAVAGEYKLSARATDDLGAVALSAPVMVRVDPAAPTTTVSGVVRDENGAAVAGASVTVSGVAAPVMSGSDGSFAITGVPAWLGPVRVSVMVARVGVRPLWAESTSLEPVGGGQTSAGVLIAERAYPGLAYIPPGTFLMGSPETEQRRSNDERQHQVTLTRGFFMGQHEVTQREYLAVTGSNPSQFRNGTTGLRGGSGGPVEEEQAHPVERVNWFDATNFCERLTKQERAAGRLPEGWVFRLPTEAEWEYACRAGTTTAFHYGSAIKSGKDAFWGKKEYDALIGTIDNPAGESLGRTTPVGSYEPNPYGLYDMHGNVTEWCFDRFGSYVIGLPIDPVGYNSLSSRPRVLRGGSWAAFGSGCRSAIRWQAEPDGGPDSVGFRVVLVPGPRLTTVVGVVRDKNGAPVAGVSVRVSGLAPPVPSGTDGGFVLRNVPAGFGAIEASAVLIGREDSPLAAVSSPLNPVAGGVTSAGVMILESGYPGMVYLPPGAFTMGSPETERGRQFGETPHSVRLTQGFFMGKYEVTQEQYFGVMGNNPSFFRDGTPAFFGGSGDIVLEERRHPVELVSWVDARNFCARLTLREEAAGRLPEGWEFRLPTEAEWEYACRGGTTTAFHYGARLESGMANFNGSKEYAAAIGTIINPAGVRLRRTSPVGSYEPNGFGLHDMHGNVFEWCSDWFGDYPEEEVTDPQGSPSGASRVARGGGWDQGGDGCRAASRQSYNPGSRNNLLGLRVVLARGKPFTTVTGVVRDVNGLPVEGARVTASELTTPFLTGSEGRFVITGAPAGMGSIRATALLARQGEAPAWAVSEPLSPVAGGETWAGVLVVKPGFPGMVYVPPGTFTMGSPISEAERNLDETPHRVTLTRGFLMGQYEVTQGEFLAVMGDNPSYFHNGVHAAGSGGIIVNDSSHPVDQVRWQDATNYCGRLTERERAAGRLPEGWVFRLPTEAEWEYACRAGATTAFHYGAALRSGMANFLGSSEYDAAIGTIDNPGGVDLGRTFPVGSYEPNGFGLYDMHGNVREWCLDWHDSYPSGAATDPRGPNSGSIRVLRGGAWNRGGRECRAAHRFGLSDRGGNTVGFRVVMAPDQP